MLDGFFNNGEAPVLEERPSVLEQLKEMSDFNIPHKLTRSHLEKEKMDFTILCIMVTKTANVAAARKLITTISKHTYEYLSEES